MTEPVFSSPTPLHQVPFPSGGSPFEADPNLFDGQLPPDPLLESGTFIEVGQNGGGEKMMPSMLRPEKASGGTTTTTTTATTTTAAAAENVVVTDATPISQRQLKKLPEELVERPNWLPDDWNMEVRVRTSGATAGTTDRYFISPSGNKLRSRKEVIHYLETGSRPNKKLKSDEKASASSPLPPSGQKQKKAKPNIRDLTGLNYDFKNPPQVVDYSFSEEGQWIASVENAVVPESQRADWSTVFTRVTQLDRSNGTI